MKGNQDRRLPPFRSKSMPELIGYLLLQTVLVPVQRLFSIRVVEGWNCLAQIFFRYLRYSSDNELHSARQCEESSSRMKTASIKEKMIKLETERFRGEYIGSEPNAEHGTILLYLHGGGYSLCTLQTYLPGLLDIRNVFEATTKRKLCMFGLDYHRAPEAKYPTQIEEAVAAYTYFREKFPSHQLFVMGDSAGGNLTLALLSKLKQSKMQQPDTAILISPWVEMTAEQEPGHLERDSDQDFITSAQLLHYTYRYLPEPVTAKSVQNPLVSPIYGDFSNTCPMFVHYGGYEWLMPGIEKFIEKLRAQRVDVSVVKEPHGPHDSPFFAQILPEIGNRGINAIAQYLASRLKNTL